MKGTNQKENTRCVALAGELGKDAYCTVYALRPSPCRSFEASYNIFFARNKQISASRSGINSKNITLEKKFVVKVAVTRKTIGRF